MWFLDCLPNNLTPIPAIQGLADSFLVRKQWPANQRFHLLMRLGCSMALGFLCCVLTVWSLAYLIASLTVVGCFPIFGQVCLDPVFTCVSHGTMCGSASWLALRAMVRGYLCVKDLSATPTMVVGSVSSKYEATNETGETVLYAVVGRQKFELSPAQYHGIACGDISSLTYWPSSRTVAKAERFTPPAAWPTTVVRLAEALRAGTDCAYALRDALLEAGYPELAEHFGGGEWPQWALDVILGTTR
jgi:hypothetical protein